MNNCEKCGNPQKMYWCDECEINQDHSGECEICGHHHEVKLDEDYHTNCNQ